MGNPSEGPAVDYGLSKRGQYNLSNSEHWRPIQKVLENVWHKVDNPKGIINLGIAENSLMHDEVSKHMQANFSMDSASHLTYGVGPRGSPRLRKALASFFNSHLKARRPVEADQFLISTGVTAITDLLTWALCDEEDGVLIPQPYYTAFTVDVHERSRAQVIPVPFQDVLGYRGIDDIFDASKNEAALEKAWQTALARGIRPRAFILTNPHNPLGKCYPPETIRTIAGFCGRHGIHLISDEIYACSVFSNASTPDAEPFVSVLAMDLDSLIDSRYVHVLYGASKDFCANGTRLGALQSVNEGLLETISTVLMFAWPSYIVQDCWARVLEDTEFLNGYIRENSRRMKKSYDTLISFLDDRQISYLRGGNAGVFVWVDLRRYLFDRPTSYDFASGKAIEELKTTSSKAEHFMAREQELLDTCLKHGVNISKGTSFFTEEIGWFRIVFTPGEEMLDLGLSRLGAALAEQTQSESQTTPRMRSML